MTSKQLEQYVTEKYDKEMLIWEMLLDSNRTNSYIKFIKENVKDKEVHKNNIFAVKKEIKELARQFKAQHKRVNKYEHTSKYPRGGCTDFFLVYGSKTSSLVNANWACCFIFGRWAIVCRGGFVVLVHWLQGVGACYGGGVSTRAPCVSCAEKRLQAKSSCRCAG